MGREPDYVRVIMKKSKYGIDYPLVESFWAGTNKFLCDICNIIGHKLINTCGHGRMGTKMMYLEYKCSRCSSLITREIDG